MAPTFSPIADHPRWSTHSTSTIFHSSASTGIILTFHSLCWIRQRFHAKRCEYQLRSTRTKWNQAMAKQWPNNGQAMKLYCYTGLYWLCSFFSSLLSLLSLLLTCIHLVRGNVLAWSGAERHSAFVSGSSLRPPAAVANSVHLALILRLGRVWFVHCRVWLYVHDEVQFALPTSSSCLNFQSHSSQMSWNF